ncbi:MAG: hypothetical protein HY553_17025 [Elusimicrobia bacterium]|nr:hypothetical protein [Elusimicrobiota bacterium]
MTALFLAALLAAPAIADDPDLTNDVELRRELEKAETTNLENAAAASHVETAKGVRLIRALLAAGLTDVDAARTELEGLLRDPEVLRRQLGDEDGDPVHAMEAHHEALLFSGQLLSAKSQDFEVKAASVPIAVAEEDRVNLLALRSGYSPQNRAGDLKRAQHDAAAAGKRLGVHAPWPAAADALTALAGSIAELKGALAQAEAAAKALAAAKRPQDVLGPARETLEARSRAIDADARDLQREADLLRATLILQMADRQITGRQVR